MKRQKPGSNLIFLISQPRAGSTLVQRILASHPDIYSHSEPWLMLHPLHALKPRNLISVFNSDIYCQALEDFINLLPGGISQFFHEIGICYQGFYNAVLQKTQKKYFLDKTPRYYLIIQELYQCFPQAKFIILFRNPAAVLVSIINSWTKNNINALYEFKADLIEAPASMLNAIRIGIPQLFYLRYEDLVANPNDWADRLCKFIGVTYMPEMLNYHSVITDKWRYGDKHTIYQKTQPDRSHSDKWKDELKNEWVAQLVLDYVLLLGRDIVSGMSYSFDEILSLSQKNIQPDAEPKYPALKNVLLQPRDLEYENTRLNAILKAQAALLKEKEEELEKLRNLLQSLK